MQTILVVDDESGVRMSLEMVFRSTYRVVAASNSAEALELLGKESPHVAILDIKMVGESGLDLLPVLKIRDPQLEVVMLTGYETIDAAKLALRRGACDFLSKPFDLGTLKQAVERAFKLRGASEAAERNRVLMSELRQANPALTADHFLMQMGVLHDVRNMQTVLNGYFDLMDLALDDMKGSGATAAQLGALHSQIKAVHQSLDTCMQMMNRFLSFGRQSMQTNPEADIAGILGDIKSFIQTHPDARLSTFVIEPPTGSMMVRVPSGDVIRLLLNVILNAAQSTKKRQNIRMRLAQVAGSLVFSENPAGNSFVIGRENLEPEQSYVTVSVQDQGPGIPEGLMQKMLQTFTTSKAETGGSGLGLGVVKQIVVQHKGALKITTVAGHGTTVSCALPGKPA
jgi:two-component system, sensor histidine kinase and response regulator